MSLRLDLVRQRLRRGDHIDRVGVVLSKESVNLRRADLVRMRGGRDRDNEER